MPKYNFKREYYILPENLDETPKVTVRKHSKTTQKELGNDDIINASKLILGSKVVGPTGKSGTIIKIEKTKFIVDTQDEETSITIDSFKNGCWIADSKEVQTIIDRLLKNDIHSKDFVNINM